MRRSAADGYGSQFDPFHDSCAVVAHDRDPRSVSSCRRYIVPHTISALVSKRERISC